MSEALSWLADRNSGFLTRLRGRTLAKRESRFGALLVSPTVVVVALVVVFPFVWTVYMSFRHLSLLQLRYVDWLNPSLTLRNFTAVLTSSYFYGYLRTTIYYSVFGTAASIGFGLVAALALKKAFFGRRVVRALLLAPYVLPIVASALLWQTMLNPQYGIINAVGQHIFGWNHPIDFLGKQNATLNLLGLHVKFPLTLTVVILFEAWKSFPLAYLFFLARLHAIPESLYQASLVDGATPTQQFRYVTLPALRGVLSLLILLRFLWTFQNFNDIYLLTGGGAGTHVVSVEVYQALVNRNDVGSAAAIGLIMSAIMAVGLVAYYRLSRKQGAVA